MSIIPSAEANALDDLLAVVLDGRPVTVAPALMGEHRYKLDVRDPGSVTVYLNAELPAGTLGVALADAAAHLRSLEAERLRPRLRALPGTTDPSAPVRPTLRVIAGGDR